MARNISNRKDIIDSRDIIARLEELQDERDALDEAVSEARDAADELDPDEEKDALREAEAAIDAAELTLQEFDDSDDGCELRALKALADEGDGAEDWTYGATLVRESYFTDYCRELLQDIGDLPKDLPDYIAIDWNATADNLRVDYSEVDFGGVTYLIR